MFKLCVVGDLGFEFWKDIPEYEDRYQASTYGRIKSKDVYVNSGIRNQTLVLKKGRVLKQSRRKQTQKYLRVGVSNGRFVKHYFTHQLVGITFLPKVNPKYNCINHKDENPENNRIENLEWCDRKYNNNYGTGAKRAGYTQRIVKDCLRVDDKEYVRQKGRLNYERNKEKRKAAMKQYRETHKEYFKNYFKEYYQTHKEKWKNLG